MFNGGNMNMNGMMKKVQKMQKQMQQMQEEIKQRTIDVTSGGGAVKITMNGEKEVKNLVIDPAAVDPEDVEMLQDMIVAAVNEAIAMSEDATNKAMSRITPMGFPF